VARKTRSKPQPPPRIPREPIVRQALANIRAGLVPYAELADVVEKFVFVIEDYEDQSEKIKTRLEGIVAYCPDSLEIIRNLRKDDP